VSSDPLPRGLISTIVGVIVFALAVMFAFPTGCADVGGVPSWERCTTMMGTPAFSLSDFGLANQWDILIPLALAVVAGLITWFVVTAANEERGDVTSDL
jgi:hypothetical protein